MKSKKTDEIRVKMRNWFYQVDGKSKGKITEEELLSAVEHGGLSVDTLVRENETDKWVKISEIEGLLPFKKSDKEKANEQKRRKKLRNINYKLSLKILLPFYLFLILIWSLFFTDVRELDAKILELLFSLAFFIFGAIRILFDLSYFEMDYSFIEGEYGEWKKEKRATKNEKIFMGILTAVVLIAFLILLNL